MKLLLSGSIGFYFDLEGSLECNPNSQALDNIASILRYLMENFGVAHSVFPNTSGSKTFSYHLICPYFIYCDKKAIKSIVA